MDSYELYCSTRQLILMLHLLFFHHYIRRL